MLDSPDGSELRRLGSDASPSLELLVEGDVDLLTAPRLRRFLTAHVAAAVPGTTVAVDMSGVTLLAAVGVRVLVDVAALGRRRDVRIVLSAMSRPVEVILRVVGLSPDLAGVTDAAALVCPPESTAVERTGP